MLKKLLEYLKDKNILILGYGMEGKSTYHFLRKHFPEKNIYIADKKKDLLEKNIELMEDIYVEVVLGEEYLIGIEQYDLIIKAPGISLKDIDISKFENKIISQLELFLRFVNVYTIGITGTKGKSTTSTLMYQILKDQGKDAFLLGNIGEPIFNDLEQITEQSIVVIELSSHALEFVKSSPNIAILLNVYEEHLDHYVSQEKYIQAKYNIAKFQNESDYFLYNADNDFMKNYQFSYKQNDISISLKGNRNNPNSIYLKDENIYYNNEKIVSSNFKMNLKGLHIVNNIMFLFGVCKIMKLDFEKVLKTIEKFRPLEHRMEYVGNIDGIDFYNDSIATIPEATINSIKAIKDVNTLIVGGKDRGVNLVDLIEFLKQSEIQNIICLPKTGEYIFENLKNTNKKVYFTNELKEAVILAKENTKKGMVCLLSPAASSYGYFKNFEERGNLFKEYVQSRHKKV